MNWKPTPDESSLVGEWIKKGNNLIEDLICKRIQWLVDSYFIEVSVDADNWSALYKNPDDNSYWELTYPQSHMQGGGPPCLYKISKNTAKKKYSF